jgi:hypothetical protein
MKPFALFRLAAVSLTILGTTGAIVACSSSSGNPTPSGPEASTKEDSGKKEDGGKKEDAGKPEDGGKKEDAGKKEDGGKTPEAGGKDVELEAMGLPDVGACKSDSSLCNSCFASVTADSGADVEVPLNACSSAVGNCIPFTGTVPTGAP